MSTKVPRPRGLESDGIHIDQVLWNRSVAVLYEKAVRRREGAIAAEGPRS